MVHFRALPENEPHASLIRASEASAWLSINLSFVVVPRNAPPSAARGTFRSEPFFLLTIWALPKLSTKKTARSIRISSPRSRVFIPQKLGCLLQLQ
ncbi:MAG: hypothetical protein U5L45_15765 [Saprospiraceae bacterium]|nr:hypothetical protein [Saprospiraceae bacterium]